MELEELEKKLIGEVSSEQVAMWKNLHKAVFTVTVDGSVAYLKKPDRITLKAMAACAQSDPIKVGELLLENCWLGGDETIKTDDEKFLGAVGEMGKLVEVKNAELKKL
jgi:hypothetical protein